MTVTVYSVRGDAIAAHPVMAPVDASIVNPAGSAGATAYPSVPIPPTADTGVSLSGSPACATQVARLTVESKAAPIARLNRAVAAPGGVPLSVTVTV